MQFNSYRLNFSNGIWEFQYLESSKYTNVDISENNSNIIQLGINLSHKKRKQDIFLDGEKNQFPFKDSQQLCEMFYFLMKIGIYDTACSKMKVFQRNPVRISTSNQSFEEILMSDLKSAQTNLISKIFRKPEYISQEKLTNIFLIDTNYYSFILSNYMKTSKNNLHELKKFHNEICSYLTARNESLDDLSSKNQSIQEESERFLLEIENIIQVENNSNLKRNLEELLKKSQLTKKVSGKVDVNKLNNIYLNFLQLPKTTQKIRILKQHFSHSIPLKTQIIGDRGQKISSFDLVESYNFSKHRIENLLETNTPGEFAFNPKKLKLLGDTSKIQFINPSLN